MNEDLAKAGAFARRMLTRLSTDVVAFDGGLAYLDRDFTLRYDSNLLWVDEPGAAPAAHWVEEAEHILGGRGYRHRKVLMSDPDAIRRLTPGFVELGHTADVGVLMVRRGAPDRPVGAVEVQEVSFAEVRPLLQEIHGGATSATDDETVRMLTDYGGKLAQTIGARFFAARVQGQLAGCCELYVDGDEAQVESVSTLEEYRGRGLGRAFVLAASDAALEAGAGWVHLWADAEDWPRHWYQRLGFHEVARSTEFAVWPQEEAAAMKAAKSPEA
jgi:N-acetylglutamate synthase-like GNAT family acetyltransferase